MGRLRSGLLALAHGSTHLEFASKNACMGFFILSRRARAVKTLVYKVDPNQLEIYAQ